VSKTPEKAPSPSKPAAKAAAPAAVAAKPAAKPAPVPTAAPAPTAAAVASKAPVPAAKPVGKTSAKNAAASASVKAPTRPEPKVPGKVDAFAPMPPVGNRFTDRFAPARPSKLPDPIEVQKTAYKADPKLVNAWKTKAGRDLTEPELLAMPDGEYMNDKQIDFFKARLQQQKDDLLSNAGETTEHLREDTSIVPDPADRATIEEEHALELRTRDRERKLLKKIAQSLARLDTGEYGFCDETGEPIGLARLLARPTATLSLEAQQRRELKQKMFGD
jgi:DnaK suppressor protein